jgi:hypothetical protein
MHRHTLTTDTMKKVLSVARGRARLRLHLQTARPVLVATVDDENEPDGRTFMTVGIGRAGYYA